MALGSLVDAGADADEVRALLDRLALPGWDLGFEEALRGGIACTRAIVRGDDVVVRTHGAISALIEDAALPPRVTDRALARLPGARQRRVRPAPSAARPGALPRGRWARRHRRHRRDGSRARGARRRHRHRLGRGHRDRDRAQRPRVAAQPRTGDRALARGRADVRPRRQPGAHDADRCRHTGRALHVVRADARHDDHSIGLRWRNRRDARPAQLHPGRDRTAGAARRGIRTAGARARDESR